MKKSFLYIHYHYPPIRNSGVYRNYFLSSACAEFSNESFLITTDNRKYLPNAELPLHPKITKFEAFTLDYRRVVAWARGGQAKAGAQFSEETKKSKFVAWLIKLQRSFPFSLLLAEGSLIYIFRSYFIGCKLIKEHKIDAVFSSFMPYADHIVAYFLKRKFPHLKWIADFRDLHVEPIYKNTIWVPFQYWVEKRILAKADLVTCVSEGISKKMKMLHHNVITITKGVEIKENFMKQYDKFTMSYSGSLFLDFRDPKVVFKAIKELISEGKIDKNKFQFLYAGKDGHTMGLMSNTAGLSDNYVDMGFVKRDTAIEMQLKSHINLLLTSSSEEHQGLLTGKMFEYFEAGNPVLCVIKGVYDQEIESIFKELNAGFIVYDPSDLKDVKSFVMLKYNEWLFSGNVQPTINRVVLQQKYSWKGQAQKLVEAIA
jgi:glycosyltransferase involved in cell wall biosynthesis